MLRWEDIEVEAQSNDQNFLPESLIQNSANREQANPPNINTTQNANLINNNINNNRPNNTLLSTTNNILNSDNNVNRPENLVRNINFNEIIKNSDPHEIMEDYEEEDNDFVPVEVMNAPDLDIPVDDEEYDENLDTSYLDLERKIKKLKPASDVDEEGK